MEAKSMVLSMTGFGRAFQTTRFGHFVVEIQSINRKHTDLVVVLPKEIASFEMQIRKWVGEVPMRGQITLRIFFTPNPEALHANIPSAALLKSVKNVWEQRALEAGFPSNAIDLSFVMLYLPPQQGGALFQEEDLRFLHDLILQALQDLQQMKQKEGHRLALDLKGRLTRLEEMTREVELLSSGSTQRLKEKLRDRLTECLAMPDFDERLVREVLIFAEKVDVSEEITRLKSHFSQFHEMIHHGGSVGRKLDFLVQEIGREINTTTSKALDSKIAHFVVEMKSELEKMREQIQNIE